MSVTKKNQVMPGIALFMRRKHTAIVSRLSIFSFPLPFLVPLPSGLHRGGLF